MTKNYAAVSLSQSIYEQAEDAAFQAQAFYTCEHVWEKVDERCWQCEACGDLADFRGWV